MSEKKHTPLAIEFADWYDKSYYVYRMREDLGYFEKVVKDAERIMKKYLGESMYEMNIDDAVDSLPDEGRFEIEKFLEEHRT